MTDEVLLERDGIVPNATPLERAIADTDGRLDDIDTDLIRRVKAPVEAPPAFLPALAWERSVDVWDPAWSDETKRAVIVVAPEVHRHKGTRAAVETALRALSVNGVITEWWEETPRAAAYTFRVKAYAHARLYDGPLLDARTIRVVFSSIMRAKPLSRAFDLTVGVGFTARLALAPAILSRSRIAASAVPAADSRLARGLGLAPALVGRTRVALALQPRLP